tara:strand:- start:440 stop:835 length:396 start_codon:yes stop_codon:yes gene_type:complete
MMETEYEEPTPFTGVRVQLEVLLGQEWEHEDDILLEGIILETQRMVPEARVVSVRAYMEGYRTDKQVFTVLPSNLSGGCKEEGEKTVDVSQCQKDDVIHSWSWRDGANKHYAEYLNRVAKASERGDEIPNR